MSDERPSAEPWVPFRADLPKSPLGGVQRGVMAHRAAQLTHRKECLTRKCLKKLVGVGGFEPPTSPLSGVRSNQLSYTPTALILLGLAPTSSTTVLASRDRLGTGCRTFFASSRRTASILPSSSACA